MVIAKNNCSLKLLKLPVQNQEKKQINKWIENKRIWNNTLIEEIKNLQNKENKNICLFLKCNNKINNMLWCNTHFKKLNNKN